MPACFPFPVPDLFPDGGADEEGAGDAVLEPLLPLLPLPFAGGVVEATGLDAELPEFLLLLLLFPEPEEEAPGLPSLVTVNCDKESVSQITHSVDRNSADNSRRLGHPASRAARPQQDKAGGSPRC